MSGAKDTFVAVYVELCEGSIQCNVNFSRVAHDWEVNIFASFFKVLYLVRVIQEGEDKLHWVPSKRGFVWC